MNVQRVQAAMAVSTHASTHPDRTDVNAIVDFYWETTNAHAPLVYYTSKKTFISILLNCYFLFQSEHVLTTMEDVVTPVEIQMKGQFAAAPRDITYATTK